MDTKSNLPPVKIAVLIDGGFFIKRFNSIYNKDRKMSGKEVAAYLYTFAHKHVGAGNVLYRIFYYDCIPFGKRMQNPISKRTEKLWGQASESYPSTEIPVTRFIRLIPSDSRGLEKSKLLNGPLQIIIVVYF